MEGAETINPAMSAEALKCGLAFKVPGSPISNS